MANYEHGKMDITEQEKTFEGMIKLGIRLSIVVTFILVFLALFNT